MAIITPVQTSYGITCGYSKITSYSQQEETIRRINIESEAQEEVAINVSRITIRLSSYVNKEARLANKEALYSKMFTFEEENLLEKLSLANCNHIQYAYTKISEMYGYVGDEENAEEE